MAAQLDAALRVLQKLEEAMMGMSWRLALAGLGLVVTVSTGSSDPPSGCREVRLTDPPRTAYECASGLVIEAEAADTLEFETEPGSVGPAAIGVERGGVLIEREPGWEPFQILTPHAIAAVRGTTFIVDVEETTTAVFVLEGAVAVSRNDGSEEVLLTDGEGVDVAEDEPLTDRQWPHNRVAELLARFGR